jgi:hypothetical protein
MRRPFVALGVLVAGLAFHNFALMVLLHLGTPTILVRIVQAWKEILLLCLVVIAVKQVRDGNLGPLTPTDVLMLAFAAIALMYFVIPASALGADASFAQRLVGLRVLLPIPILYLVGRVITARSDADRAAITLLSLGAGALVTIFGVAELFFVPTRVWLDLGVNQLSSFLGFVYNGPRGLPENFFITITDNVYVRRMVSTYVSPLGIAYTAMLLVPLAIGYIVQRPSSHVSKAVAGALGLVILGVALSVTRLAVFGIVAELLILAVLLRKAWIAALVPLVMVAGIAALTPWASPAPVVDRNLNAIPHGNAWTIPGSDSSGREHYDFLRADLAVVMQHPLGLGTGASTVRYGELAGTGESAVLGMFGDLGMVGGSIYVALYALALWHGYRALRLARGDSLEMLLPLVTLVGGLGLIPITMTSDVWGDLSVTFLFWWSAGASATLCAQRASRPARIAVPARRRRLVA